jgi:archaemetzincin
VRRNGNGSEASSNGRTADFGSAYEGSNPSASATPAGKTANLRAELRPLVRPSHVLLVALGSVHPKVVQAAGEALKETLEVPARAGPALDRPQYAFNKDRGQYHATSIIRRLATLRSKDAPVVGLLDVDLFLPDAPYVIGDADRDAGAAVFSLARLASPDPDVLRRRARVETVHAAGHLFGLSHCSDFRCAMFFSRDAADCDRKGPGPCASCRNALGLGPR